MVYNITNYALIKQYGYYYTVQNCTISTQNEDIQIIQFESQQLLNQHIQQNNIEMPITYQEQII